MGNKWTGRKLSAARRGVQRRRHRPVRRMRTSKEARPRAARRWITEFRCGVAGANVRTTLLTHVLHVAHKHECGGKVRVKAGEAYATNWTTLKRVYGETVVKVLTATGRQRRLRLRQVQPAQLAITAPPRTRIVQLKFERVQVRKRDREELDRLVRVLGTTRTGGQQEVRQGSFELLEHLWARRHTLSDRRTRERAESRLCSVALRGWGVSLRARPMLRIPGDPAFPAQCVRRAADRLFSLLGGRTRPQVRRVQKRVRVVRGKPVQVGEQLVNWRKWCAEEYVPGVEPECV